MVTTPTFSFADAYRIINNVIDERIRTLTKSGAGIDYTWGTVAELSSPYECSVYLFGENLPSAGFKIENGIKPNLLDPVRVAIDKRGNRWIEAVYPDATNAFSKFELDIKGALIRTGDGTVAPVARVGPTGLLGPVTLGNSESISWSDVVLSRLSADVIGLAAGDTFDGNTILSQDFVEGTTASIALTAATEAQIASPVMTLPRPSTGRYRLWVVLSTSYSMASAGVQEFYIRVAGGSIVSLQKANPGAGVFDSFTMFGWIDSVNSGTDRASSDLAEGGSGSLNISVRMRNSVTQTVTVYTGAPYATGLYAWITRLP